MKKNLITTTAAVATVMSASAAYADLSLGGAMALKYAAGDSQTGWQGTATSYTVNVDYTTTLDNGMGYAVNVDIAGPSASVLQLHTFSTDMGSVFLGTDFTSAVDSKDYVQGAGPFANNPASTTTYNGLLLNGFNDGDALTDNGIGMSTSVAGADVMVTSVQLRVGCDYPRVRKLHRQLDHTGRARGGLAVPDAALDVAKHKRHVGVAATKAQQRRRD